MIGVTENDDKTFTISWDENDPQESIFNNYTEEDFIKLIQNYLQSLQESGEIDINQVTEAVNHINDHIEETYGKECYEDYIQASYEVSPYYEEDAQERGNQGNEQSKDRTVPPPENFPLFP